MCLNTGHPAGDLGSRPRPVCAAHLPVFRRPGVLLPSVLPPSPADRELQPKGEEHGWCSQLDFAAWGTCCRGWGQGPLGLMGLPCFRELSPEGGAIPHLSGQDQHLISILS